MTFFSLDPCFDFTIYATQVCSHVIQEIMDVFMDDFFGYGKTFNDCLENLDSFAKMCRKPLSP